MKITPSITPWPEQLELSTIGLKILKENGLVYLAMEERTGKTLTAILIAEDTTACSILVLTKSKALDGWENILNGYIHLSSYTVTTYGKAKGLKGREFDLVILDEPHAYVSAYPKTSKTWLSVKKIIKETPCIYCSATPYAQGIQLLFNQFKLCYFSPWDHYTNFYKWYEKFSLRDKEGKFFMNYIGNDTKAIDYTKINTEKALAEVKHLFVTKTRAEMGFEHEPEDELHYIELGDSTREIYNTIMKDKVLCFDHILTDKEYTLVCDSGMKLRSALHMLEGGVLKIDKSKNQDDSYLVIGNREKVDYILDTWGDTKDVVIMYNYKGEQEKLESIFKNALILQASSYAEGVDLSMYKHLVIYSQDFSTAKHTQRRARQANKKRDTPIKVHFLLVKKAVSEQVYKTVSKNKRNFVDSVFEREEL